MSAWDRAKAYGAGQWKRGLGEVGAPLRQGTNDARNILMGPWGDGENTPGTAGYPTQQEVTDAFGGTHEQRMQQVKEEKAKAEVKGKEEPKAKTRGKAKGREVGD